MYNLIKTYIIKPLDRRFTRKQAAIVAVIATTLTLEWLIPTAHAEYIALAERLNPPVEYTYTAPATEPGSPEKLEQYYQEELKNLEEKYQRAHHNAARTSAIERVEADLEAEKQELREEELLL